MKSKKLIASSESSIWLRGETEEERVIDFKEGLYSEVVRLNKVLKTDAKLDYVDAESIALTMKGLMNSLKVKGLVGSSNLVRTKTSIFKSNKKKEVASCMVEKSDNNFSMTFSIKYVIVDSKNLAERCIGVKTIIYN